jgi:hypothetical protein
LLALFETISFLRFKSSRQGHVPGQYACSSGGERNGICTSLLAWLHRRWQTTIWEAAMTRILAVILVFSLSSLFAGDDEYSYLGVNNCKMCHKKAEKGEQFGIWSKSAHAGAMETLKGEAALKIAQDMELEAAPHEAGECLVCHATGWGKAGGYEILSADFIADETNARAVKKNASKANVGCESCHGAGSGYKSKKTMEGIRAGEIEAASVGLLTPNADVCATCHNEKSPTYKEFDFEAMAAKIAHPYPE